MVDELSTVVSVQPVRVQYVRTARSCSRDIRKEIFKTFDQKVVCASTRSILKRAVNLGIS
jgi:hypothetical protein